MVDTLFPGLVNLFVHFRVKRVSRFRHNFTFYGLALLVNRMPLTIIVDSAARKTDQTACVLRLFQRV